jgi:hypothetical protein
VDPVSLVLNALTSGAAQGIADSVSDVVKSAYDKLKQLVTAKFAGSKSAELALEEHAADPVTWQAPLTKALTTSGAATDEAVLEAAQQLMALLDPTGTAEGKYQIDLRGAQGVQVGDGNQQFNTFNSSTYVTAPPTVDIRPGRPRNEVAFGEAFEAAGGRARLGRALDEVYEDGPGWVQQFDGGSSGQPAVICALFGHSAVAVDQGVWNALGQFGRSTHVIGTAAVGFPVGSGEHPLITADGSPVELDGGAWGRGRLVPRSTGGWQWEPETAFDSEACRDQDTWSFRRGEMDLRLRLAARMLLVAEGLRVTEAGRSQILAELASTGLTEVIASLANRYDLESTDLDWHETPEPEGFNNNRFTAYQLIVPGADGRPALLGSLWFTLPGGRAVDVSAIIDLCIDFDAIEPATEPTTPAQISPELRITVGELVSFFTSAWREAVALVLTTGQTAVQVPPAGASRLELYIQNRHPEPSGGSRVLRTLDLVDLSVFGRTRKAQFGDLSVGVTAPLSLGPDEIGTVVRQALVRMASDFGFTAAETSQILLVAVAPRSAAVALFARSRTRNPQIMRSTLVRSTRLTCSDASRDMP